MFHLGWDHMNAKLIDQRFLKEAKTSGTAGTGTSGVGVSYQVWEYIVEFPDTDGKLVRRAFNEKTYKVRLPGIGGTVPILVNKRRTKTAFDVKNPRINANRADEAIATGADVIATACPFCIVMLSDAVTAKQAAGDVTGDASTRREGRREERKGEEKDKLADAQDRVEEKSADVADLERKT